MLSTQQSARPPLSMLSSSVMGLGMSVDTAYAFLKTKKTLSYTSARVSKRVCLAAYSTPYFVPDTMGYRPLPLQIKLCVSGRWRFDCTTSYKLKHVYCEFLINAHPGEYYRGAVFYCSPPSWKDTGFPAPAAPMVPMPLVFYFTSDKVTHAQCMHAAALP